MKISEVWGDNRVYLYVWQKECLYPAFASPSHPYRLSKMFIKNLFRVILKRFKINLKIECASYPHMCENSIFIPIVKERKHPFEKKRMPFACELLGGTPPDR